MSYMLILVLANQGSFGNEFTTKQECLQELARVKQEVSNDNLEKDIVKLACEQGIVLSESE